MTIIRKVSDKFDKQEYEFAVPYFFEKMANGDLTLDDIEAVIKTGHIQRKFTRNPLVSLCEDA